MSKPVIVCVDDEPTVLESLKIELKRVLDDSCLIETAEGGEEALELLDELQQEEYDVALVLVDYIMPDIKGDELLREIHTRSPHTLNIMISGQADLEAVGNAIRDARLFRYIAKPWAPDDLRSSVIEAIQSFLQDRKLEAQAERLRVQAERERSLNRVVQAIRQSLNLNTIFSTTVSEIGNLLQVNQVGIARYIPEQSCWHYVAGYRKTPDLPDLLGMKMMDSSNPLTARFKQLDSVWTDHARTWEDTVNASMSQAFPGSWLFVPLVVDSCVWGNLSLFKGLSEVSWQDWEVELVQSVADQLAIAIQQSQLYHQVQQFNVELERQVQERTSQLQQMLEFEAMLQRITDKVRESLDEKQILQTAVQELAVELGLSCCDAALYDLDRQTSEICYEYVCSDLSPVKGTFIHLTTRPDVYEQVLQGRTVHCCILPLQTDPPRGSNKRSTVLICPLRDEEILGDMWLFKPQHLVFDDLEIRIAQHVADQCAIALRQSRLYQLSQAQVTELERLSQVKDDFLSNVSHELRSPMSNMAIATHMLETALKTLGILEAAESSSLRRYLQILKDECQRETNLINDLLDIARLEAEATPLNLTTVELSLWLPLLVEPFLERTRNQNQNLVLNVPSELPPLTTDPSYLERSLGELIHNACKYTPIGETIRIDVCATAETFQISVRNSGIEIPDSEHDRIFDKFYRIVNSDQRKQGGTGLGLALVKKQIERLQGVIQVSCEPGWTIFTIQFPNFSCELDDNRLPK